MTASPLLVHSADRVVFLAEGRQVATGRHQQLLDTHRAYRAVVNRGMEEGDDH